MVYYNEGDTSRKKQEIILKELGILKEKYNLRNDVLVSLNKYASRTNRFKEGNLLNLADFINQVLISFGYNPEEVSEFMNKHKVMFDSNYADFRYRLALFNKFGSMEDTFFKGYSVLTNDITRNGCGTKDMFSILKFDRKNGREVITPNELFDILPSKMEAAKEECPFNMEELKMYDNEMVKDLLKLRVKGRSL